MNRACGREVRQVVEIIWDRLVVLQRFETFLEQIERLLRFA
jgi:hypothetical protein